MSESNHHQSLVKALATEIASNLVWPNPPIIYCDVWDGMGADLPPIIGSNRPDVFARDLTTSLSIIGEAKTANDIDNRHTYEQLASYFDHLCHQPHGELWMGVPWLSAGTATRVCTRMRKMTNAQHIPIRVVAFMIGNINLRRMWCE